MANDSLFGVHAAALEVRSQRMGLLASNIANAATPGYKARDIDFAAALQARMQGASEDQAVGAATRRRAIRQERRLPAAPGREPRCARATP